MNETADDSILAVLKREPQRTQGILRFSLAAAGLIVVVDFAGSFLLPDLVVLPIMLFLILAYAGVLTYLIANLVRAADRWQMESAMQARRMVSPVDRRTERSPATPSAAPVAPPAAVTQADFHRVYFLLRLNDEVQRARREGRDMSVVALDVTVPGRELTPALVEKVGFDLAHMAASQSKTISQPVGVGPTEFVFSLPQSEYATAKSFLSKVVQALGDYWCHYGIAVYPDDATDAESLYERARQQCEASRQDRARPPRRFAEEGTAA
jgi:hypothetical protein